MIVPKKVSVFSVTRSSSVSSATGIFGDCAAPHQDRAKKTQRSTPVLGTRRLTSTVISIALGAASFTFPPAALADPAPTAAAPALSSVPDPANEQEFERHIRELLDAPIPQDFDGLLAHMKEVSRVTGATNEEVSRIREDLDKARGYLKEAKQQQEDARRRVDEAQRKLDDSRAGVAVVSQALYRGAYVDPVTAMAGASGPEAAIERGSYMSSLTDSKNRTLAVLDKDVMDAAEATSEANRATFRSDFRINDLQARQTKLDARSKDLEQLKKRVMEVVDGLSPQDRQRWVDSNGPIDVDVEQFLNKLGPSLGDHSGVVAAALSKLGSPYGWGSAGPNQFDCSGLMLWAYQQLGKSIPRTSQAQLAGGSPVSREQLQPGDIVAYYPGATHVGMYIGDGQLVHASDYGIPVQVVPVDSMPMVGAVRY